MWPLTITHSMQCGLLSAESRMNENIMYATGSDNCPVGTLDNFINKADQDATQLFNQNNREAINMPKSTDSWYNTKPLGKRTFAGSLSDICKSAKVEVHYTPHCVWATAIQMLNDHIKYLFK